MAVLRLARGVGHFLVHDGVGALEAPEVDEPAHEHDGDDDGGEAGVDDEGFHLWMRANTAPPTEMQSSEMSP